MADSADPDIRTSNRFLLWLTRKEARPFAASVGRASLWLVSLALTPAAIGAAVTPLIDKDFGQVAKWVGVVLALAAATALGSIMRHRSDTAIRLGASLRTVRLVARQSARLGSTLNSQISSGETLAVGVDDINQVAYFVELAPQGIAATASVIVVAVLLLTTSAPLGLTVLIGAPLLLLATGPWLRPLQTRASNRRDRQADLAEQAGDIVAGLRVLRGIGGEASFAARYRRESQQAFRAGIEVARIDSVLAGIRVLIPGIFAVAVLWLGARLAIEGSLSPGQLVAFYGYAAFLAMPMRIVTLTIGFAVSARVAAGRVIGILALARDEGGTASAPDATRSALTDPDSRLTIPAGSLTVVAASDPEDGAALAERLGGYRESAVTLDGTRLADLPVATVRELIMLADNDAFLFSGPLTDELTGSPERVSAALRDACADMVVAALPDGLDTPVAERGLSFSGGEQQRIRLARALLADPPILLLVEPTSALDSHTETAVAERLRAARIGRTTVVISTSPALLDQAEMVAYLESGQVMATGTHYELAAATAGYAQVISRQ